MVFRFESRISNGKVRCIFRASACVRESTKYNVRFRLVGGYTLEWKGESVEVSRPDIQCINGIIHVIDQVLITDGDIQYSVDGAAENNPATMMLLSIFVPLVVMGFYH